APLSRAAGLRDRRGVPARRRRRARDHVHAEGAAGGGGRGRRGRRRRGCRASGRGARPPGLIGSRGGAPGGGADGRRMKAIVFAAPIPTYVLTLVAGALSKRLLVGPHACTRYL